MVAYSFFDITSANKKEFVTDNCTLFFDGNQKECCIAHDKKYYQGDSLKERQYADVELRNCIYSKAKIKSLSYLVYYGVRIAGTPFVNVSWRWGYGWKFGRSYW